MNLSLEIESVTPIFSYGVYQDDHPEIRPASIRGQLRFWFRAIGGNFQEEQSLFGSVANKRAKLKDHASRLVVRVANIRAAEPRRLPTLPHKNGGHAAPKMAFPAGTAFTLLLSERLGGLGSGQEKVVAALRAWLMLGGFGGRATRGGGSLQVHSPDFPSTVEQWESQAKQLLTGQPFKAALLERSFRTELETRTVITDTIGGPFNEGRAGDELVKRNYPLGVVRDKGVNKNAPRRKTSPLRLRVYRFGPNDHRIIAVWDGRQAVTGNAPHHLGEAIRLLRSKGKQLGLLLENANWITT